MKLFTEKKKGIIFEFFKILLCILIPAIASITGLLTTFSNNVSSALQQIGFLGFLTILLISIIVSLLFIISKHYVPLLKNDLEKNNPNFFCSIVDELQQRMKKKEHSDVIRIGCALSRALWISGDYENRTVIGELVLEAATKQGDVFTKIRVLIDDLGWTNVILEREASAICNIKKGIELAKAEDKIYWTAKGYRHLFNIYLIKSKYNNEYLPKAKEYLDLSKENALKIVSDDERIEMLTGIDYGEVELLITIQKYKDAIELGENILRTYEERNDSDRLAKAYSQLGKIYFLLKDYTRAISSFSEGLAFAEENNRLDEQIKCSMGLAVCYSQLKEFSKVKKYIDKCNLIYKNKFDIILWNEILLPYSKINKGEKNGTN